MSGSQERLGQAAHKGPKDTRHGCSMLGRQVVHAMQARPPCMCTTMLPGFCGLLFSALTDINGLLQSQHSLRLLSWLDVPPPRRCPSSSGGSGVQPPISNRPQQAAGCPSSLRSRQTADCPSSLRPKQAAGFGFQGSGSLTSQQPQAQAGSRVMDARLREAQAPAGSRLPAGLRCCQQQAGLQMWKVSCARPWDGSKLTEVLLLPQAQRSAPAACQTHQVDQDGVAKAQPGSFKELIQQLLHRQHARLSAKWVLAQQKAAGSDRICWCQMFGCCCVLGIPFSAHQAGCWSIWHLQTHGLRMQRTERCSPGQPSPALWQRLCI